MKSFADIPAEVRRRVDAGERVILILFDAFGWSSSSAITITRLIQRLEVTPLTSQFPSTMTAHVPSVRFGMPCTSTVSMNGSSRAGSAPG